jgi:hypothetical protein
VLQAVELPAGVSHLDAGLAYVDGDAFTLEGTKNKPLNLCFIAHNTTMLYHTMFAVYVHVNIVLRTHSDHHCRIIASTLSMYPTNK